MKNPIFPLFLLLALAQISSAQVDEKDPLVIAFENATDDSTKLVACKSIIVKYGRSDFTKTKAYIDIGMAMIEGKGDDRNVCFFMNNLGKYYHAKSELDSAEMSFQKGLELAKELNEIKVITALSIDYATTLLEKGEVDKAVSLYLDAAENSSKNEFYDGSIACYFGISSSYQMQGNYEKALEYVLAAGDYCSQLKGVRQSHCESAVTSNAASFYFDMGKYPEALAKARTAEEIKIRTQYTRTLDETYLIIGGCYLEMDSIEQAIEYFEKGKRIADESGKKIGVINASNQLIKLYLNQKDNKKAAALIRKQEPIIEVSDNVTQRYNFYQLSSMYYTQVKDYPKATMAFSKYVEMKDSVLSVEKNKAIEDVRTKYETDKISEEKIHAEEIAAKNHRSFIATLVAALLALLAGVIFFIQMRKRKKAELAALELSKTNEKIELQRQAAVLEKAQVESELKALRSQMNPHFIFNSLNSIQDLILDQETDLSYDYVVMFSKLVRKVLHHSEKKFIPLEQEVEFLETYLSLEKLRFEEEFHYEINNDVEEGLEAPSLLIQPFIENAIVHGLLHKKGEKHLEINYAMKDKLLVCTIEDNGVGREKAMKIRQRQRPGHESFSMDAIRKRLAYLSEQEGVDAGFEIEDVETGGTRVIVKMPCNWLG